MIPFRVALTKTSQEGVKESRVDSWRRGPHPRPQLPSPVETISARVCWRNTERSVFFLLFQVPSGHQGLPCWLSWYRTRLWCRRHRFNSWAGKIPWRRKWQPTPVFLPGDSHGQKSLVGYSPRGHRVRPNWATTPPPSSPPPGTWTKWGSSKLLEGRHKNLDLFL